MISNLVVDLVVQLVFWHLILLNVFLNGLGQVPQRWVVFGSGTRLVAFLLLHGVEDASVVA